MERHAPSRIIEDGSCDEIINMRYENGAWRPIIPPRLVETMTDFDTVHYHPISSSGYDVWVGFDPTAGLGDGDGAVVIDATNNTTLEHAEGTGNQDLFMHKGADESLLAEFGGWHMWCDGSNWFDVSHAQHV